MRFKRAMAASMAAVMAVSSAVVCQITASAAAESQTLATDQAVTGTFNKDGNIELTLLNKWGNAINADDYKSIIFQYDIEDVGNANAIKVAINGNGSGWDDAGNYTLSAGEGKLEYDMSKIAGKTFEWVGIQVSGAANEECTAKITIKSVILKSKTSCGEENVIFNNPSASANQTVSIGASGQDVTFDFSKYSKNALLDITVVTDSTAKEGDGLGQIVINDDWNHTQTIEGAVVNDTKVYSYCIGDIMDNVGVDSTSGINSVKVQSYKDYAKITKIAIRDIEKSDVEVSSITIEGEAKRTATYGDADVELTVKPDENATTYDESKVTWASSNEDVATVSADGKVTFVGAGSAKITATYDDNKDITASVDFTVAQKAVTMTINASDVTDATVDDAQTKAEDSIVLSTAVTPLSPDDYELTVKLADDKKSYTASVALTEKGKTKYALTCEPASGKITYKVTGLKLSTDKLPILASNTDGVQLTATVLPADLAEGEIEWTTADNTVATVENGLVKPVSGSAGGKTTITAAVKGTDVKATCEVSIVEEVNPAVSIKLDKEELSGTAGDKAELKADVTAQDTSKDCTSIVVWKSSDEKVATVSNGVVTFVGEGTAEITATAGDVSAVCKVSVKAKTVAVEKVTLDKTSAELTVGDTATLKASVTPDNATDKTVTWTSSDDSVASVKDGVVTAVKAGTATITAKSGDKTATCTVTVKDKKTIFSGKADIKPTELNSWNDNVQIGAANVEETSVIRIRYSIIDGAQHQIKVQDGADWNVLTSIKTNEWGVTEVSKDGVLVIKLNKADAEAVAKGGLAITGIGIRVEDVDFNVVEDSKKYPASTATKTEFVKTTVNSDNTLNMLAVFSISEEDAKNFEAFVVTVQRSSDSKIYYDIVETYYDAFDYTADGVMHEGVSENGKHLIVLNLVNADPSWGSITVKIEPAVPKG